MPSLQQSVTTPSSSSLTLPMPFHHPLFSMYSCSSCEQLDPLCSYSVHGPKHPCLPFIALGPWTYILLDLYSLSLTTRSHPSPTLHQFTIQETQHKTCFPTQKNTTLHRWLAISTIKHLWVNSLTKKFSNNIILMIAHHSLVKGTALSSCIPSYLATK